MPEFVFVMAPRQNYFFVELVGAIRHELDSLGVTSRVSLDGFPTPRRGEVYVLAPPHEYFVLEGDEAAVPATLLARTLFLCAEQPGTVHFEQNLRLSRQAGAVFDISSWATSEFRRNGIEAQHLQLGYSRYWDGDASGERDIDVLFLGCSTPRRDRHLASYVQPFSRLHTRLILSDNSAPNYAASPNFLVGEEKLRLLRRSKAIINLHQGEDPYFEWLRVLEAIHCGCVVVSEHSAGYAPLVPGSHFVSGRPETLGLLAEEVAENNAFRRHIAEQALTFLRDRLPARVGVESLVAAAERIDRSAPVSVQRESAARPSVRAPKRDRFGAALYAAPRIEQGDPLRMAAKELRLDMQDLRREVLRAGLSSHGQAPPLIQREWLSLGYRARPRPRVSVLTANYNHGNWVLQALESVNRGSFRDFELIVVDDGSSDASVGSIEAWGRAHPEVALALLRHPVNRGLPRARNAALDFARGEYVLILDADNDLLVNCLSRLVTALDRAPADSFAYGMLACFDHDGYSHLVSHFPWQPLRLRRGNYIDALALIRTQTLRTLGGYSTDRRLYGWEDYDLWCRMAEGGHTAAFVPELVARYRVSPASMLSITNLSVTAAQLALREHCPTLMGARGGSRVHAEPGSYENG